MKKAAIDIGSNSIRLLIADLQQSKTGVNISVCEQGLVTTRLASGASSGFLLPETVTQTVEAIAVFCDKIQKWEIGEKPYLLATSAVREAQNPDLLQAALQEKLGLQVQILSGEEEAWYTFCGATATLSPTAKEKAMVIDIGGGSTEWVRPGPILLSKPLGAVKAQERQMAPAEIADFFAAWEQEKKTDGILFATGGTATAAAAMLLQLREYCREAVQGVVLKSADLQALRDRLFPLSVAQRKEQYPLLGKRADIIVSGLDILLVLLRILGKEEVTISDSGILDGFLLQRFLEKVYCVNEMED